MRIVRIAILWVALGMAVLQAEQAGVDLLKLKTIRVPEKPTWREEAAAKALQTKLKEFYKLDLQVAKSGYVKDDSSIVIGREPALASGKITKADLEKVKYDGYVIKGSEGTIVIAGYRGLGTQFAAYCLLERLGLRRYAGGRLNIFKEVFTPLKNTKIEAFSLSSKPFLEYRTAIDWLSQGSLGSSYRDCGSPQEGANPEILGRQARKTWAKGEWLGGDHTAPYLVPKQLYYDKHPEYFAMKGGKRIPKTTVMQRMTLCLSNPDVHKIAAQRMLEWMDIQSDRRFFYCTDADSGPCQCPACLALDPMPYSPTDRYLKWVNSIARAVRKKYPAKILLASAYYWGVKPPVKVKPESNVLILYAPWYWDSVNTRTADFAHPRNITAMEEFMAWSMLVPGQMGVYDYPAYGTYNWMGGHIMRLKWYARHGVKALHCCGSPLFMDGLFHDVTAKLNWDPFLDSGELEKDYLRTVFGPAGESMLKFWKIYSAASRRQMGGFFSDEEMLTRGKALLKKAVDEVANEPPTMQLRVQREVITWLEEYLRVTNPRAKKEGVTQEEANTFRDDVVLYVGLSHKTMENFGLIRRRWDVRNRQRTLIKKLDSIGISYEGLMGVPARPKPAPGAKAPALPADLHKRKIKNLDVILEGVKIADKSLAAEQNKSLTILGFGDRDYGRKWRFSCTSPGIADKAMFAGIARPTGETLNGVRVSLPFTKLPLKRLSVSPEGRNTLHAGSFLLERKFSEAMNAGGCDFLEFRFHASTDVPIGVYVDLDGVPGVLSDFNLHAGEQIVRMDLRNHARGSWGRHRKAWNGKVTGVKVEFWPQDHFYPHPEVRDARVMLLGMTACSYDHTPQDLPYAGKAVWLTQFRSNLQRDKYSPVNIFIDSLTDPARIKDRSSYFGARFRTSTAHRALSPVFAILTAPDAPDDEKRAAAELQGYLEKLFGVRLPVNPAGMAVGPDTGNAIILGRQAALASGRITERELKHVGREGYVLRAHQGRIVIAGSGTGGTHFGISRYLEDHGVRFFEPGVREVRPDLKNGLLHELYVLDWPYFANRKVAGGWKLCCQDSAADKAGAAKADTASVVKLAEAIKDCGRSKSAITGEIIAGAAASPLHRYIAAKLLWNPFQDTSRLMDEFMAPD